MKNFSKSKQNFILFLALRRSRDTCRVKFIYYRVSRCRLWVLLRDHDFSFLRCKVQNEFIAILTIQKVEFVIFNQRNWIFQICTQRGPPQDVLNAEMFITQMARRNVYSHEFKASQNVCKVGAVNKKLASLEATLVRNYDPANYWQGWSVDCSATNVAKNI